MDHVKKTSILTRLGFATILALIVVMILLILFQFKSLKDKVNIQVDVTHQKYDLAATMRDAIRLRAINLLNMAQMDDSFELDEELLKFNENASHFASARISLEQLETYPEEIEVHNRLQSATRISQPLATQLADQLLIQDLDKNKRKKLLSATYEAQQNVLIELDKLVKIQELYSHRLLKNVDELYIASIKLLATIGLSTILVIIFVMVYIEKYLSKSSKTLKTAAEAKSMFLANMSHEIRTPLTAIIGFTELLHRKNNKKLNQRSVLKTIRKNAFHLLQLINDILDISKIEANKLEIEKRLTNLFEILQDIEYLTDGLTKKKGIEFKIINDFPLPRTVNTDPVRLKQILLNLCTNAIKFTERGHVHVRSYFNSSTGLLNFEIQDTGIGLTEEQCKSIFNSFSQADSSTTRQYGGTGLGLTISKQLTERLGGEISVDSTIDKGSCFKFSIDPGVIEKDELCNDQTCFSSGHDDVDSVLTEFHLTGEILLVEDTKDNQTLITAYLEELNARVTIANNGQEALDLIDKNSYDMVLMDMQMPVMGGLEALTKLREQGCITPVAMLTANAFEKEKQLCMKAGCNDFLLKPIDSSKLTDIVKKYLTEDSSNSVITYPEVHPENIDNEGSNNSIESSLFGKKEKFDSLVKKFIEHLPSMINNIQQAHKNKDMESLKNAAHQLKGTGGNYGYPALTLACINIEKTVSNSTENELQTLIKQLEVIQIQIQNGLNSYEERKRQLASLTHNEKAG